MHYCLTNREDSEFWRRVRRAPVPDSLQARLERAREGVLVPDGLALRLFEGRSTACILSGMDFAFRRCPPVVDLVGEGEARALFEQIQADRRALRETMPDHHACVRAVYEAGGGLPGGGTQDSAPS